jgi:hypothetical protein
MMKSHKSENDNTDEIRIIIVDELAHHLVTFTPIFALFSHSFYTNSLKRTVLSFI